MKKNKTNKAKKYQIIKKCAALLLCFTLLSSVLSCNPIASDKARTVIICFDNFADGNNADYLNKELKQIKKASKKLAEQMSLVLLSDTSLSQDADDIDQPFERAFLYELSLGCIKEINASSAKAAAPEEPLGLLSCVAKEYPAAEYYLIYINGQCDCICEELKKSSPLTCEQMSAQLCAFTKSSGKKLSFIALDTCIGAQLEGYSKLCEYADYIVANQELSGFGYDYDSFFASLKNMQSAQDAAVLLAKGRYELNAENDKMDFFSISVTDCKALKRALSYFSPACEELAALLEAKANSLFAKPSNTPPNNISNEGKQPDMKQNTAELFSEAIFFGLVTPKEGFSGVADLKSVFAACNEPNSQSFISGTDEAVIYKKNGIASQGACGINIYFPLFCGCEKASLESYEKSFADYGYSAVLKKLNEYLSLCRNNGVQPGSAASYGAETKLTEKIYTGTAYTCGGGLFYDYYSIPQESGGFCRISKNKLTGELTKACELKCDANNTQNVGHKMR